MFRRRRVGELQGILAQSQEETSSTFSGILLIDLTTLKLGIGRFKKMFANKDFFAYKNRDRFSVFRTNKTGDGFSRASGYNCR